MSNSSTFPDWHGTTILAVRKDGKTVVAGDGQVSMGQTIVKGTAKKVRKLAGGRVIAGFAGSTADAFTLIERLEAKLEQYPEQLARACVDLAKDWRTDRYLRRLEAMLIVADKDHEETMVKGAIRTDFILSGEIMVIALNEVIDEAFAMRAATLIVVAIAITIAVYGAVGLIVKMDDIGLHMAKAGNSVRRAIGRGLVAFMPKLLGALALVGTAAMLWVGGQIILHALDEYHIGNLGHGLHDFAHAVAGNLPAAGVWEWLINAGGAGVFGLVLGGVIVAVLHLLPGKKAAH